MKSWCAGCGRMKQMQFQYVRTEDGLRVISTCNDCGVVLETFRKWEPVPT